MSEMEVKPKGTLPTQFSVLLKNRAGALSSLVRLLHRAKIEVVGLSMQDSHDVSVARLVLSDPDLASQLFIEKGIAFNTCELCVVALRDVNAGLSKCLDTLRAAETNVDFTYTLLCHPHGKTLLAMHLEDTFFGVSVLSSAGVQIVYEEDLLR
ncbi:acetolactate synthase [Persicirhabdus sediminis]|uniref:Acetolactate synthase n=1 Tax=Persicirhabdus sediminis TaxID=454144 RepID=A0A8J7MBY2_9BACT|nr:acetolactate synthase [Persicirhabdus sediminis]MBK1790238.1 acetolactate synthase [Persicirhabdus sediminis]